MGAARYTVLIPIADELGNRLNISMAAYEHIVDAHRAIERATIHPGNPYDALVAWAQETPETDSTIKQLGVFVAEVANVPVVTVTKEGKSSVTWHMRNKHYRLGDGAEPSALATPAPQPYDTGMSTPDYSQDSGKQTPHVEGFGDLPFSQGMWDNVGAGA